MDTSQLQQIVLVIGLLIVSLGIHEAAHGWVALKCGDPTARDLGRITLDPLAHIDLVMTILLPTFLYMSTGFVFGGAKPVPVNFNNLRRGHRDMALVALAGPMSNLILAVLFMALLQIMGGGEDPIWSSKSLGVIVLSKTVALNLLLTAFNLIPIPPLDGSRIMTFLLPAGDLRNSYRSLEPYGMIIVIALILIPGSPLGPFISSTIGFLWGVIEPLTRWLA